MSWPTIVFSHGQESGPSGNKIRSMSGMAKTLGCGVCSIDYRGIADPAARVAKLIEACSRVDGSIILVGSSMGGYVATVAASAVVVRGLFVLAPAYYLPGYEDLTPVAPDLPFEIVHGWHDNVVPAQNSIRFAGKCCATLHLLDDDHRLTRSIDDISDYLMRFISRVAGKQ